MGSWVKVAENLNKKLEHDDIDELITQFSKAFDKKISSLKDQLENVTTESVEDPNYLPDYKDYLCELINDTEQSKLLGHELSIVALYKRVEIKIKKVTIGLLNLPEKTNLSSINQLKEFAPFITSIGNYDAYNELRCLNNAIKHVGFVSKGLAKSNSKWEVGHPLDNLDSEYSRLLPSVKAFFREYVEKLYHEKGK